MQYTFYNDFIKNSVVKLSKINILYIKFFQWVINDTIYNNEELKNIFINFSRNVEYINDDIDYLSLLDLVNNKDIRLESIEPINSGTISIIYKGYIKDNNKNIVVKLLKKNIETKLINSIDFFKLLTKIANYIPYICYFNLENIINENSEILLEQTNFLQEVKNIENFKNGFLENDKIIIPNVYKDFTINNNRLIIMDYISGENVYSLSLEDRRIFTELLYEFIFDCLFEKKIFHGDLHTGNIIFIKENENDKIIHKIGIIDYGIVTYIDDKIKELVFKFFMYLFDKDFINLFKFIINNLTEKINVFNTVEYNKEEILNSLLLCKKDYNILNEKTIQSNDTYHINKTLSKYNLVLSVAISKVFVSISCMYSLLQILRKDDLSPKFETAFYKHLFKTFSNKIE
jgi:predicted unusual protein kinase regulating ubiquinone biosynthesis (AarF/ABC1/UbiB family)